jgi:predicted nucleic acid-binding protein
MNGNRIVLDTNIILYLLAGDETLSVFLEGKEGFLSVITELELIGYPAITELELIQIKNFLKSCLIIAVNEEIKDIYARLRRKYKLKLGDAATSATAIYLDLPFISADKGFNKITELQFILYAI